jgi:hypothetical protein
VAACRDIIVHVEPPGRFASLARWECHLCLLESLPPSALLKNAMIETAREVIAWKREAED